MTKPGDIIEHRSTEDVLAVVFDILKNIEGFNANEGINYLLYAVAYLIVAGFEPADERAVLAQVPDTLRAMMPIMRQIDRALASAPQGLAS